MKQESRLSGPAVWCLAGLLCFACITNHDGLALKPAASGGAGDAAGQGDAASAQGGAAAQGDSGQADVVARDVRADMSVVPASGTRIALMHGVVDADRITFCVRLSHRASLVSIPSSGLAYGESVAVSDPLLAAFESEDVDIYVVTGDVSARPDVCATVFGDASAPLDAGALVDRAMLDAVSTDSSDSATTADTGGDTAPPPVDASLGDVSKDRGIQDAALGDATGATAKDFPLMTPFDAVCWWKKHKV